MTVVHVALPVPAIGSVGDAIRMPRYLAASAIALIGRELGSVLVDPDERALYVFVPLGTAHEWTEPDTVALASGDQTALPAPTVRLPPGRYWLIPPTQRPVTNPSALRRALREAMAQPSWGRPS